MLNVRDYARKIVFDRLLIRQSWLGREARWWRRSAGDVELSPARLWRTTCRKRSGQALVLVITAHISLRRWLPRMKDIGRKLCFPPAAGLFWPVWLLIQSVLFFQFFVFVFALHCSISYYGHYVLGFLKSPQLSSLPSRFAFRQFERKLGSSIMNWTVLLTMRFLLLDNSDIRNLLLLWIWCAITRFIDALTGLAAPRLRRFDTHAPSIIVAGFEWVNVILFTLGWLFYFCEGNAFQIIHHFVFFVALNPRGFLSTSFARLECFHHRE